MTHFAFKDPLWLAAFAPLLAGAWLVLRARGAGMPFMQIGGIAGRLARARVLIVKLPTALRIGALALIVLALARPQQGLEQTRIHQKGIDIVLAVDVSTSMLAEDFKLGGRRHNRLEVVKQVIREFVENRPNDRIGVVVFAGRPYTQTPLTLDHGWLLAQLDRVKIGMIEDGTAIGSAIATGLNRLRDSDAKSRVLILLSDGANNAGDISPEAAAELAKSIGVRVYTVGAGTRGPVPYPARDMFGRKVYQQAVIEVDEASLRAIARKTGARFFRATNTEGLRDVYEQIDQLEKTDIEQPTYMVYKEFYLPLIGLALVLLLAEALLKRTVLRVLP